MGKVSIWFGGAATAMLGLYYAASAIPQIPPITPLILFVAFSVFAGLSLLTGAVYIFRLVKRRLQPLDILDEIRCTYWPKEKQVQVRLWICDYSNSPEFNVSCLAQFGSQVVNVTDRIQLDGIYIGNTYCRGGRKRMVEFLKNDVEVKDSSQCLVKISMKPLGMWTTRKKSKQVATEVVNH